jgi:hypothetical protein
MAERAASSLGAGGGGGSDGSGSPFVSVELDHELGAAADDGGTAAAAAPEAAALAEQPAAQQRAEAKGCMGGSPSDTQLGESSSAPSSSPAASD